MLTLLFIVIEFGVNLVNCEFFFAYFVFKHTAPLSGLHLFFVIQTKTELKPPLRLPQRGRDITDRISPPTPNFTD